MRKTITLIALLVLVGLGIPGIASADIQGLPSGVTITPSDEANLSFDAIVGESCDRGYTVTNGRSRPITISRVRSGRGDDWNRLNIRGNTVVPPGGTYPFTVTYHPVAEGSTSTNTVKVTVKVRPNRSQIAKLKLTGTEGISCKPPEEEDEDDDESDDDESDGGVADEPVQQDDEKQTICIRFRYVDTGWDGEELGERPNAEQLDECLRRVSGWYSGVDFEKRPKGEPDSIDDPNNDNNTDPHCITIFLVHEEWFEDHPDDEDAKPPVPTNKVGEAELDPRVRLESWDKVKSDLSDAGMNDNYLREMSKGTRITAEVTDLCSTVGHELGHTLGLGQGPGQSHNDPGTNQPIGEDSKLMHKEADGTGLSDAEQAVAKRVAQFLNEHRLQKCESSSSTEESDSRHGLRSAHLFQYDDGVYVRLRPWSSLDPAVARVRFSLEFDSDLDGKADRTLSYAHTDEGWSITAVPDPMVAEEEVEAPPLPAFGMRPAGEVEVDRANRIETWVPHASLARSRGAIGWRVTYTDEVSDVSDVIPDAGFATFHLSEPSFALDLDSSSKHATATAGATLTLTGTVAATATFGGPIALTARLRGEGREEVLLLSPITAPIPTTWSAVLALPADLEEGSYDLQLFGVCEPCRSSTSIRGKLEVRRSGSLVPWVGLVVLLLLVVVAVTVRRLAGK